MFETVIWTLIYIGLLVGVAVVILWALAQFGLNLPPRLVQIFWAIVVLLIILVLWRMVGPLLGSAPRLR